MPPDSLFYLMSQAIAEILRAHTANMPNRIDPMLIMLGEDAGFWIVPAAARTDFPELVGTLDALQLKVLDMGAIWPPIDV